jgi:hypothetical protein
VDIWRFAQLVAAAQAEASLGRDSACAVGKSIDEYVLQIGTGVETIVPWAQDSTGVERSDGMRE